MAYKKGRIRPGRRRRLPTIAARIAAPILLVVLVALVAERPSSAHRRDEYLQAARIAIDPDRVEISLDLTPGVAVAERVLDEIDLDRNRTISREEAQAYSTRVLRGLRLDVDRTPLRLELADTEFPAIDAILKGEGAVNIRVFARMPDLAAGAHHLHYRNDNRPDIGVYLANALVPVNDRVAITAQRRDVDQRDLVIDYTLGADAAVPSGRWISVIVVAVLLALAVFARRDRGARHARRSTPISTV